MITGANRGLGAALVAEALSRGAGHVYAGTRRPLSVVDHRITPMRLDVTDAGDIAAVAREIDQLDVLINNAGVLRFDDLTDHGSLNEHLAVNLFGPHALTQALLPRLIDARGRLVNILSIAALAPLPVTPAYSLSKAAAFSMTQSWRALLAATGVRAHAVLAGPIDTDMIRDVQTTQGTACRRGSRHLRRGARRPRRDLPRPHVRHHRGRLGRRRVQGNGAGECEVPRQDWMTLRAARPPRGNSAGESAYRP